MADGRPESDFGARAFSERNRWFSWLGLVVGVGLIVAGALMALKSARDRASMPTAPLSCPCRACPEEQWVRVADPQWRCELAVQTGGYRYARIDAPDCGRVLLAAVETAELCQTAASRPAEGVIGPARGSLAEELKQPALVLWLHAGPGNSMGLIVVGALFVLVGLLCVLFYRARLRS
jgi:hypothetical protein